MFVIVTLVECKHGREPAVPPLRGREDRRRTTIYQIVVSTVFTCKMCSRADLRCYRVERVATLCEAGSDRQSDVPRMFLANAEVEVFLSVFCVAGSDDAQALIVFPRRSGFEGLFC